METWKLQPAKDLGMPLGERLRSLRRESGLLETAAHLGWWSLVQCYFRVCHRFRMDGAEHIPAKPPFVLVANHASHLDTLALACPLPWRLRDRVFPIAAGDTFFDKPVMTVFAAGMLNALPLWRKHCGPQALKQLRQRLLEEPCAYILFPEGTRSRDGKMRPFKGGLGMLVAETSVPVVPCHLEGTFEALPPHRRVPSLRPIRMRVGEPVAFASVKNEQAGWKEIATRTEAAVRRLSGAAV
ncbi:MAG TPA: lysophospholipid acyltransferase family protein [Gemmataceae bacterium]|jgi:1-acyl-sn-glycerol-3-phosphate acyltransferase|nr:lysophospholipid acyltransferase family protein [Gemmataceae bacterium]